MPEKTRLLFLGEMNSSHAQSWVNLLLPYAEEFEIQAINISPWATWERAPFPVYSPVLEQVRGVNCAEPLVVDIFTRDWYHYIPQDLVLNAAVLGFIQSTIDSFAPHIVHTFGFFPSAVTYAHVLDCTDLSWRARWVLQVRGGRGTAFTHSNPYWQEHFARIVPIADAVICDTEQNFILLGDMSPIVRRHPALSVAPGTGGCRVNGAKPRPVRERERVIIWGKAYEAVSSKALPVLEGIKIAWEQIKPVRVICTAVDNEVRDTVRLCPRPLQEDIELHSRIPRDKFLKLFNNARVMLAPSLTDGIPNTLYEAMISGLVPIVSPLETLTPHFEDGKQVLYARNLYPDEIAEALIKAMNDDALADGIVRYNAEHFPFFARRPDIQRKLRELYQDLAGKIDPSCTELGRTKALLHHKIQAELTHRILNYPAFRRAQRNIWKLIKLWK